jgi:hypothetical protein
MLYYIKDGMMFIKSPLKTKKYRVYLNPNYYVDFGAIKPDGTPYEQYKDGVSDLYEAYSHYDDKRRERYYKRHSINYDFPSADWFSKRYLWT